jgi:hypothetical protein
MLDVYCILYFFHLLGGFLHICAMYMYYICGLWPPDNVGCLFITWYQSPGLGHPPHAATRVDPKLSFSSISSGRPRLRSSLSPAVLPHPGAFSRPREARDPATSGPPSLMDRLPLDFSRQDHCLQGIGPAAPDRSGSRPWTSPAAIAVCRAPDRRCPRVLVLVAVATKRPDRSFSPGRR